MAAGSRFDRECSNCGATFGPNVWDLVVRQGMCPHCRAPLKDEERDQARDPGPSERGDPS